MNNPKIRAQPFYLTDMSKLYRTILNEHAPVKSKKIQPNQPIFMNNRLRKAVYKKTALRNKFRRFPNNANWEAYRKQRNLTTKIRKDSIKNYFFERCTSAKDGGFWPTVKPFIASKSKTGDNAIQLLENNKLVTEPQKTSEIFNHFYVNIANEIGSPVDERTFDKTDLELINFSIDKYRNHPSISRIRESQRTTTQIFNFLNVNKAAVQKLIQNLNPKKSTGFDQIPPKLVKASGESIASPLCNIINSNLETSIFPNALKCAEVIPIYKKADNLQKKNYRPVSLLSSVSKIFEHVINNQLQVLSDRVLSKHISAYRKGHCTQSVLLYLTEKLKQALDNKQKVGTVLMDLSKAFDSLPFDLLVAKLNAYGMSQKALQLMTSYIRNRKQRVKIGSARSSWLTSIKGTPQGSIIGPTLFNFFINDFMYIFKKSEIGNYANDNSLYAIAGTMQQLVSILRNETALAIDWFRQNNMQANPEKFQLIYFGSRVEQTELIFNDFSLEPSESVTLLVVQLDINLNFSEHISKIVRRVQEHYLQLGDLGNMSILNAACYYSKAILLAT